MARTKGAHEERKLNAKQLDELAKCIKNIFFFSLFIRVVNPVQGIVPFALYPFQKSVLLQFLKNRFNIILKFRQAGITELISMYCLWLCMFQPNKKVIIISIKDSVAKKVLKKIKFMYKNIPWYLQTPIINGRPGEMGSATLMEFSNGSTIESIPTSEQAGRSEAVSLLVIDEAAMVRWASTIWASAFPTLSTGGAAILNSCVTGDTKIVGRQGDFRIDTICPTSFGRKDISHLGLEVLSHTGKWQRVLSSVNKGELETWEIVNRFGDKLKCTPKHKLLTTQGWKTVKEIVENNLETIVYKHGLEELIDCPITTPPKKEKIKQIKGFPNYSISNHGKVYITKKGQMIEKKPRPSTRGINIYQSMSLYHQNKKTKKSIHNLVAEAFIGEIPEGYVVDHIDSNPQHNYSTNLEIVTLSENTRRAALYSRGMKLGCKIGAKFPNLQLIGKIREKYKLYGEQPMYSELIAEEISNEMGIEVTDKFIRRIAQKERTNTVQISKIKVVRKYLDMIYDISVEEDQSYITYSNYVNHNTPSGIGGFFHGTWVDAISGSNGINPIRLYWEMHPERDISWYDEMANALGPKRTAQEIDGDFLSSGNMVFDPADIRSIEESLYEHPIIKRRLNGQLLTFNEPKKNYEYFIGADCATGRAKDYSSFTAMDETGEESEVFKGKIPLNKFSRLLADTGERHNFAKLAPETNDIGMAVTMYLQDEGYPNLYYHQKLLKKKRGRREFELIPGWLTTSKNRSLIIEGLEKDIREENILIKDPFFIQEAYTFIYDGAGRPVAMGKHKSNNSSVDIDLEGETYSDDNIFGKAICNHARKYSKLNSIVTMPQ